MKIKAVHLKKIYNICSSIDIDLYIYFENQKLISQSRDGAHVCMAEIIIKQSDIKKSDTTWCFDISKPALRNILKVLVDDDIVDITEKDNVLNFKYIKYSRNIRMIEPTSGRFTMPDERTDKDKLVFPSDIDIFSSTIKDALATSQDVSSNVKFKCSDYLKIIRESELDSFEANIKGRDVTINKGVNELNQSMFLGEYLNNFFNHINGKINIKTGENLPIKITNASLDGMEIKYMQAPLIEVK